MFGAALQCIEREIAGQPHCEIDQADGKFVAPVDEQERACRLLFGHVFFQALPWPEAESPRRSLRAKKANQTRVQPIPPSQPASTSLGL